MTYYFLGASTEALHRAIIQKQTTKILISSCSAYQTSPTVINVFLGDFNFKDINWVSWTTFHNTESKEAKFIETARECYLHQHNQHVSRRRGNDEPSLIDLVFTDVAMQVSDIEHHSPLGKSDHNVITFKFHCYLDCAKPKAKYVYGKADFDAMRRNLVDTNWEEQYNTWQYHI